MIRELIDTEVEAVVGGTRDVTFGNITLNPTINANGGNATASGANSQARGGDGGGVFNVSGFNFSF